MVTIRQATAIVLLVLIMTVVATPVALAAENSSGPDQGSVIWEKDTQYWPDESQARYGVDYPTVQISDISPGASNEFRLVIRNLTNSSLDFDVTVESSTSGSTFKALPKSWVDITSKASDKPGQAKPVTMVNVPAADLETGETGIKQVWVHVSVPDSKKWKNQKMQGVIKVVEAADDTGPTMLVTVTTADHMAGAGEKNAPVILGILLVFIIAIGGAIYGFSRWRWPDHPREKKEDEAKGDSSSPFAEPPEGPPEPQEKPATGLNPADWQGQ
jgi:hypothetical protein